MKKENDKSNDDLDNENLNLKNDDNFDMSVFDKMPSNTDILQKTSIVNSDDDVTQLDGQSEVGKKKSFATGNKALTLTLVALAVIASIYGVVQVRGLTSNGIASEEQANPMDSQPDQKSSKDFEYEFQQLNAINAQNAENEAILNGASEPYVSSEPVVVTAQTQPDLQPVTAIEAPPQQYQTYNSQPPMQPTTIEPTKQELRLQRILSSDFNSGNSGGRNSGGGASSKPVNFNEDEQPQKTESGLGKRMGDYSTFSATQAGRMSNRDLTMDKGTFIDCVLTTRFNSQLAGMLSCQVTRNVYSASGRVILVDRGSVVTGQYQGDIKQGEARVFVMWDRIVTPKGVAINVNSPSASALGESGLTGRINTHFWKNLGNAFMVSLVGSTADATGKSIGKSIGKELDKALGNPQGTSEIDISSGNSSSSSPSDVAVKALEQIGKTVPTITKNQGDRIMIYVARDVDFSKVYRLN